MKKIFLDFSSPLAVTHNIENEDKNVATEILFEIALVSVLKALTAQCAEHG